MSEHDNPPPWIDAAPPWEDDGSIPDTKGAAAPEGAAPARPSSSGPRGMLHALYKVEREGAKSYWLRIGTAFPNKNQNGYTLSLDALPLNFNGKILLSIPRTSW